MAKCAMWPEFTLFTHLYKPFNNNLFISIFAVPNLNLRLFIILNISFSIFMGTGLLDAVTMFV